MMKLRINQRWIDDTLVLLMLCISGNPAFIYSPRFGKIIYGLMFLLLLVCSRLKVKVVALKQSAFWLALLSVIFVAQYLLLGQITILGSLNFATKMLCAILFASYLGNRLPKTAIRVMSVICAVSLVFYLINLTGVRFTSPLHLATRSQSLIVYTQSWEDPDSTVFRNSGMFWEPGAFAGYIIATLLLFVDRPQLLWTRFKWHSVLLSVALLTTTSTTGYITFAMLVLYFILRQDAKGYTKIIIYLTAGLLVVGSVIAFNKLDFLGQKIKKELLATERQTETDINVSRTGSIVFDMQYILTHPIFGNGLSGQTRFRFHLGIYDEDELNGFGNGFSGCIASMGLLFMLSFLIAIGLNPNLNARWMVILTLVLLLQGEYFLNYPWFMMYPFIQFGARTAKENKPRKVIRFVWNKTPLDA